MNRLREPSTWMGLVSVLAAAAGYTLSPERAAEIATGVATIAGCVLIWVRERS